MSAGRVANAESWPWRLRSCALSPGWLMAATAKPASASAAAVSWWLKAVPPEPCETMTSGSGAPCTGQSRTASRVSGPMPTGPGGVAQGVQIAPRNAGPWASAGTSIMRRPAAWVSPAARASSGRTSQRDRKAACAMRATTARAAHPRRCSGAEGEVMAGQCATATPAGPQTPSRRRCGPVQTTRSERSGRPSMCATMRSPRTTAPTFSGVPL